MLMPINELGVTSPRKYGRYNAIEERDLLNAASKLDAYFQTNTVITPVELVVLAVVATA